MILLSGLSASECAVKAFSKASILTQRNRRGPQSAQSRKELGRFARCAIIRRREASLFLVSVHSVVLACFLCVKKSLLSYRRDEHYPRRIGSIFVRSAKVLQATADRKTRRYRQTSIAASRCALRVSHATNRGAGTPACHPPRAFPTCRRRTRAEIGNPPAPSGSGIPRGRGQSDERAKSITRSRPGNTRSNKVIEPASNPLVNSAAPRGATGSFAMLNARTCCLSGGAATGQSTSVLHHA